MDLTQGILNPCPASVTGTPAHLLMTFINTLITSQCILGPEGKYPQDHAPYLQDGDEYDFIIVGSGSAGSVVASRLSENPNWKVLLLEAGDYPTSTSEVPFVFMTDIRSSNNYFENMEPSTTACLGLKNKVCQSPRGKALGGSSTLNGMIYLRGSRKDFDSWAEEGNTGWDYDSVLKHYKKFEDLQGVEDDRFGKGGNLKISHNFNNQPIRKILMEAYQEVGYAEYNEEKPIGYLDTYTTISDGTRSNTAKAFLSHARMRENLHVALNAQVSRLLIKGDKSSVYGVQVRINNQLLQIKSTREVILSAGTMNSPQILMNSGIGPEDHLNEMGIPIVRNLKVGENLQDHLAFGIFMNIEKDAFLPKMPINVMDDMYQYFMHRKGPLSRSSIENFVLSLDSKHNFEHANMQLYYIPFYQNDLQALAIMQNVIGTPDEVRKVQTENNEKSHNIILLPTLLNPKSKGKIWLRSTDPFDKPKIHSNYLSDEGNEDLQAFLEVVRFCQNLTTTKAFSRHKLNNVHLDILNCRIFLPDSDEYWKCAVRNLATTLYHPVGTCKMGPNTDSDAVVDPRLRVYGIKGVRVIDASIMPNVTSVNTNAPSMMIGEKGAAMIKEDWMEKHTEL